MFHFWVINTLDRMCVILYIHYLLQTKRRCPVYIKSIINITNKNNVLFIFKKSPFYQAGIQDQPML